MIFHAFAVDLDMPAGKYITALVRHANAMPALQESDTLLVSPRNPHLTTIETVFQDTMHVKAHPMPPNMLGLAT